MVDVNIQDLKKEYNELSDKLSDPSSLQNNKLFQEYSTQLIHLQNIIETYETAQEIKKRIEENKDLVSNEDDTEMVELAQSELEPLQKQLEELTDKLDLLLIPPDPNDFRNAILEIRAGTGGEEAGLFAGDLYRMYARYCERNGFKIEQLSSNRSGNGGYKEIIVLLSGKNVYGNLKFENGVHRVQRVPQTESSGRIHTSAVSVVVLPEVDDVQVNIKDEDLRIDVYRAGGPGGQSVNTTDSAVRITHLPTGIIVTCQDGKSQLKNKEKALSILKSKLYDLEQAKQLNAQSDLRNSAIQGGDRSAKIRTYNFQQSRITDHRIKQSWYNFNEILDGEIQPVIDALKKGKIGDENDED